MMAEASAMLAGQPPGAPGTFGAPGKPPGIFPQLLMTGTLPTGKTPMSFEERLRPRLADILLFSLRKPGFLPEPRRGTYSPFLGRESHRRIRRIFRGIGLGVALSTGSGGPKPARR